MRREQAVRINDHLLDALEALEKAEMAIADLAQQERLRFDDLLDEILLDLHEKLLVPIYEQHPDLEPPEADENPFRLGSDLVWDEVRLPPSVTEDQLDEIIFQLLKPRWQKTAMLVIRAIERCRELGLPIDDEVIAARLKLLSDSDRIEGIGDLRIWTHSEVRLKD
jgi:hypothetical protein